MGLVLAAPGTADVDGDNSVAEASKAVREACSISPSKKLKGAALIDVSTLQLPQLPTTALLPCYQCMYTIFVAGSGGGGSVTHKTQRCRQFLQHTGADYLQDARYASHQTTYRTRATGGVQMELLHHFGATATDSLHDHSPQHETISPKRKPGRPSKGVKVASPLGGAGKTNVRPKGVLGRRLTAAHRGRPRKLVDERTPDLDFGAGDSAHSDDDPAMPELPQVHLSRESHLTFSLATAFRRSLVPPVIYRRENSQGRRTVCFILPASTKTPDGSSDLCYVTDPYNPLYLMLFTDAGCSDVHVACNKCDGIMMVLPRSLPGDGALFHMCAHRTKQGGTMCGCGRTLLQHVRNQTSEQDFATDKDTFEHIYSSAPDWVPEFERMNPEEEHESSTIFKVPVSHQGTVPFPYRVVGKFGTLSCGVVTRGPRFAWKCTSCSKMFGCPHRSMLRSHVENICARPINQQLFYKRSSAQRFDGILQHSVGKDGRLLNLTHSKLPIPDVPTEKVMKQLNRVPVDSQDLMKMRDFSPSQTSAMAYFASVGPKQQSLEDRFVFVASTLGATSRTVLLCDPRTESSQSGSDALDALDDSGETSGSGSRCHGVLFTSGGVMPCTVQSSIDPVTGLETYYDGNADAIINVDGR